MPIIPNATTPAAVAATQQNHAPVANKSRPSERTGLEGEGTRARAAERLGMSMRDNVRDNGATAALQLSDGISPAVDPMDSAQSQRDVGHVAAAAAKGFGGQPDLAVPAISLSHWDTAVQTGDAAAQMNFAKSLDDAFGKYGFVAIVDHGIHPAVLEQAYAVTEAFFRLPADEKNKLTVPGSSGQRGYTATGETAKGAAAVDLKEFVQLGRTQNPSPEHVPAFLPALDALMGSFDGIGKKLLAALSLYEVGDAAVLPNAVSDDRSILRLIHYPPLPDQVPAFSERAAAHEDINLITLLLNARAMSGAGAASGRGLQLKVPMNGQRAESASEDDMGWVNAVVPKDALIVNVGEMLERWTNGAWRATTHRVINPEPCDPERQASRLSLPFFVHPKADFSLTPHPASIERADGEQHYTAATADEALQQRLMELGLRKA